MTFNNQSQQQMIEIQYQSSPLPNPNSNSIQNQMQNPLPPMQINETEYFHSLKLKNKKQLSFDNFESKFFVN